MRTLHLHCVVAVLLAGALVVPPAGAQNDLPDMTLKGLTGGIRAIAFSPDGKTFAAGGELYDGQKPKGGVIGFWETASGTAKESIETAAGIGSLSFSPDGKHLAAATFYSVHVFDMATGKLRRTYDIERGGPSFVAYSRDGTVLAAAVTLGPYQIKVWDPEANKVLCHLYHARSWLKAVGMSADGSTLVGIVDSFMGQYTIAVWDPRTGAPKRSFNLARNMMPWAFALSADGKTLAMAINWEVGLYDSETWVRKDGYKTSSSVLAFSPDGKMLANAWLNEITVWDLRNRDILLKTKTEQAVGALTWSPDSRMLAGGAGQTFKPADVYIWKVNPARDEEKKPAPEAAKPAPEPAKPAPTAAAGEPEKEEAAGALEIPLRAGEMRLEGILEAVQAGGKAFTMHVTAFTAAGGKSGTLDPPRLKKVVVTAATLLHAPGAEPRKFSAAGLKPGASVAVVGKDAGPGKPLTARVVVLQ